MNDKSMMIKGKIIYIFGAQSRAKTLKGYLQFLYPEIDILSFLVDDMAGNDEVIDNIPVLELGEVERLEQTATVLIATKGIYHAEIKKRLEEKGMQQIIPITVEVDNLLRNEYVKKYYEKKQCSFTKIEDLYTITEVCAKSKLRGTIYVAKSIYDKPLQTTYNNPIYEQEIQVGAALTEERLEDCGLLDSIGDNISSKNRQYCELTALYWLWKHATDHVIGLAHYRRHFVLPNNWLTMMEQQGIDVILPVPTYVSPSITENYMQRHDPVDWKFLLMYLEHEYPQDYICAKQVFEGNLYSPCNMFIMRKEILDDLCAWMFPILDAVVENGGIKDDIYLNRYPGFISERLITLYFYKNNKYKIVYADKNFIA